MKTRALASVLALSAIGLCGTLSGCTQTLSDGDCKTFRDRLVQWGEKKGKLDQKALDDFMKTCPGTNVSKGTYRCLDKAGDETTFFQCLE